MVTFDICQLLATPGPFEYFCQNTGPSENQSFLNEGAIGGRRGLGGGGLGGQITGLHDVPFFGGCDTLKGCLGASQKKGIFQDICNGLKGTQN